MSFRRFKARRFIRDEGGATAVEFALVSVAFLTFIFAIIYLAIILFANATLQWAVDKGSRIAAINPAATQTEISDAVNQSLSSAGAPTANVTYSISTTGVVKTGKISANFTKTYTVPMIKTFTINYSATTTVPLGS
jgi:Flp pilus assembly protein TadG